MRPQDIAIDWPVFAHEGEVAVGAVRRVSRDHLVVYVENAGDVRIALDHVRSVHDAKVVIAMDRLPEDIRALIEHAHDGETRTS